MTSSSHFWFILQAFFFATTKLSCGLLTTIHHHYKFISKKILRLLDNLRNAPVSTLNHDLSFVLYCQSKIRIRVCMYYLFESIQMKHFFSLFPSILVLENKVWLKVSKSRKQIFKNTKKNEEKNPDSFHNIFSILRSFFGRIENSKFFFEIYWPLLKVAN